MAAALSPSNLGAQCPITVDAGPDQYRCAPPGPVQLQGSITGPYLNFSWSPPTGLSGSNTLTPTANVTQNMTYVLTARAADLSNNLIVNGDFEGGPSGFDSDYTYNPGNLVPEGVYDILPNPQTSHSGFAPCDDHTSGSGNMMAVNGAGSPNQNVWCQTIAVTPNTQYVFSAWVTTLVATSPANLQFSINGTTIGPVFNAPNSNCVWLNFYATWTSGAATSATICIVNQNTVIGGNDFALDDILFSPVCVVTDTVQVSLVNVQAAAAPAVSVIPCAGAEVTLNGAGSSTGPDVTYNWETTNGNIVSGQTTLTPVVNAAGTYTLTVTYDNGFVVCTKTATVNVVESPNPLSAWILPPSNLGCGANTVTLIGNSNQPAFSTYQWTASGGGNIVSGETSKNAVVDQPGTYTLLVTNTANGCTATTDVEVSAITDIPVAQAAGGTLTCAQPQLTLSGAGSSQGATIAYAWTTPNGSILSGQTEQDAVTGAAGTYILAVTNTANNCTVSDTVSVTANQTPPSLNIAAPDGLDCQTDTVSLQATVNPSGAALLWSGPGLAGGQGTATALAMAPGVYILTATNTANGCSAADTVAVTQNTTLPTAAILPPAQLTCLQTSLQLSGNGSSSGTGFAYLWGASAGGNIVSGQTTLQPTVNSSGTYTLTVTDTGNFCTATATVAVTSSVSAVVAVANAPDTLDCVTTQVTLNANGSTSGPGLAYAWTTTNGSITGGADTPTPGADAPGTYRLILTNIANGCADTALTTVFENTAAPSVQIAAPGPLTCTVLIQTLQGQLFTLPMVPVWTTSDGVILSGGSSPAAVVNSPGTYVLTVTNPANGCSAADTVTVVQNITPPVAAIQPPGVLTCLQPSLQLSGNGSSTGMNYAWTASAGGNIVSGSTTLMPTVNTAGNYTLVVTDPVNACKDTATITVTSTAEAITAVAQATDTLDCATTQMTLSSSGSTTGATITYAWTTLGGVILDGDDTATPLVGAPGVYALTVTNTANGCTSTTQATVVENTVPPSVQIAAPGLLTCTNPTQTLQGQLGSPLFVPAWTTATGNIVSGEFSPNAVVNAPGVYVLTATNPANGCTASASVTVNLAAGTPIALLDAPGPLTCTTQTVPLITTGTSTGPNFTYAWGTANGGNIVPGPDPLSPLADAAGTYNLTVTNTANGCSATATLVVLEDVAPPPADAGPSMVLTCNEPNTTLTANGGNPAANLSLLWETQDGQLTSNPAAAFVNVNQPGLYTLLVTNLDNGCTATDAVTVTADQTPPVVQVTPPMTLTCIQTTVTLHAVASGGALAYQWQTTNGNLVSGINSADPVVDEPGNYTVTVTNAVNGCVATGGAIVFSSTTPPNIQIGPAAVITCVHPVDTLQGQLLPGPSNVGYLWTAGPGGSLTGGDSTLTPTVDAPGTYTLTATNFTNGCTAQETVTVTMDIAQPTADAGADDTLSCSLNSLPLSGSGTGTAPLTYLWTASAGGQILSGAQTPTPSVNAAGIYALLITNTANGCTATDAVQIFNDANAPQVATGPATLLTCDNPDGQLQATLIAPASGVTFSWSTADGNIVSGADQLTPLVDDPGTYILTLTNTANGCTALAAITVTEDVAPPQIEAGAPGLLTCTALTDTLQGQLLAALPEVSFVWSTVGGQILSGGTTLLPVAGAAGQYILLATNLTNGCTATATTEVAVDTVAPVLSVDVPATLTCILPMTGLQAQLLAPLPDATYAWTTGDGNIVSGANTLNPTIDAPGTYLLTVENTVNGCTATITATADENVALPQIDAGPGITLTCADPALTLQAQAGSAAYEIAWSGPQIIAGGQTLTPLIGAPGVYSVTATDPTNGCTATATATAGEDVTPPSAVIAPPAVLTCLQETATLQAQLTPPSAAFTFSWSTSNGNIPGGQTGLSIQVDAPGNYLLNLQNPQNGCTASVAVAVGQDVALPTAEAGPPAVLHCNNPDASLQGSGGGGPSLIFAWTTPDGLIASGAATANPLVSAPGQYLLTVTNTDNGCTAADAVSVSEVPAPDFAFSIDQPDCHQGKGAITFGAVSGGAGPFVYSANGGQSFGTSTVFTGMNPGDYTLMVEDANGCTASAEATVDAPFIPTIELPDAVTIEFGDSVLLLPVLNLPVTSVATWAWTPADGLSCTDCPSPYAQPARSTVYQVNITDLNGCKAESRVRVLIDLRRKVYAPNVFVPGHSGPNAFFNLYGKGVAGIPLLEIFDRWGNQLYLGENLPVNDEFSGWDGMYRGQAVAPAVYVWQAKVLFTDGEELLLSGDVTVMR